MSKIGLLAGNGNLPVKFAFAARNMGQEVITIAVTEEAKVDELKGITSKTYKIDVGELDKVIETFKENQIKEVVMLGKVTKELLYQGVQLDKRFMKILSSLKEKNDDEIMLAIVKEFEGEGIEIVDQSQFIKALFPKEGVLTAIKPSEEVLEDMEYGFKMAKEIGRLDIGQTVVVKDQAVMAVEGIEGTDQAILRGGELGRGEVVVAKVSKPNQDLRFDIPTIGLDTIEKLIEVRAKGLVIEAGKTFVVNQEEVVKRAEEAGIPIVVMGNNS